MSKKQKLVPGHSLPAEFGKGLMIIRSFSEELHEHEDVMESHRDDWHLFLLQEKGTTMLEVDFEEQVLGPASLLYVHPAQIHRLVRFRDALISSLMINDTNLKPETLRLMEEIRPAGVLKLDEATFSLLSDTASLCIRYSERAHEKLYPALMADSCNTLATLATSQYLALAARSGTDSRHSKLAQAFKTLLEQQFASLHSPSDYAALLHVSTAYLNECVKNATGYPVSHQIQQRIVLEAKRLLYHSGSSVKEIAAALGYDDYSYFIRLFTKAAGMTPLAFRTKNRG
ncbi:MAG: helix-turn-helix domain-containing protein [Chitinophagaceae bacterium]